MGTAAITTEDYLAGLSPERRARLEAVRDVVRGAYPDAVEGIEWGMPVFRRGARWFGMASQRQYVSLYLGCEAVAHRVAASDARLKHGKACVNVRDTVAMPVDALRVVLPEVLWV